MVVASLGPRVGIISAFDDHRGLGTVTTAAGTRFPFHCTAIADGTRTIEERLAVRFEVVAGRAGRWEAHAIVAR